MAIEQTTIKSDEQVEKVFNEYWREMLTDKISGEIDFMQVKRELYDYRTLLENVPKVYCHVTQDRISKPNTLAEVVIGVADGVQQDSFDEWHKDECEVCKYKELADDIKND